MSKYDFPVNTPGYDEISPVLSYSENFLFFTRIGSPNFDKTLYMEGVDMYSIHSEEEYEKILKKVFCQIASETIVDVSSSGFNQDIWVVFIDSLFRPFDLAHPGHPLNNALPNSICTRFDDHDRFILINKFEKEGGLDTGFSISQMKKDSFTFPEPLVIENFLLKSLRVNITSSRDQNTLLLAMPNENGDMDIFVSKRLYYQHYSTPIPIKTGLNTDFDEMTPFLSDDGFTLFFASNRPESIGGTDIFSVTRKDDSYLHWGDLKKYTPPMNSSADEMYPVIDKREGQCIFSSNRDGSFDIFQINLMRDKSIEILVDVHIVNGATGVHMPGELYWKNAFEDGPKFSEYFRVRDGKYKIILKGNTPFTIKAENRNLKSKTFLIDPQEIKKDSLGKMTLTLTLWPETYEDWEYPKPKLMQIPIDKVLDATENQPFSSAIFENLQFEKSTAVLLDKSLPTIHTLSNYLKENPAIHIKITGHTDNIGNQNDLVKLSIERANAIKNILVTHGVAAERITTEGAGSSEPVTDNTTEAKRKINRRVEIHIIPKQQYP